MVWSSVRRIIPVLIVWASAACAPSPSISGADSAFSARFAWFEYEGVDPDAGALEERDYRNPVLAGFYPDPSIVRAGDDYYLVNSTFAWFPGIPVFHSRDLVHWTQIGSAIDRPGMLDFSGLGVSRGVFAPAISFHEGRFYITNTCVDCGGNFIVTAEDPAGPWSDPVWLPEVGGIDSSLFFDDDGSVYVLNNDEPPGGSTYSGHRAIWIRQIDPATFQSISAPTVLIDGGVHPEDKPIWIEGPHIYKVGAWYYLCAAEGGTALGHSQVVLRSKTVLGPYESYAGNPILTQRDLDPRRANPVTSVGHADLVQVGDNDWWAVVLGVRPYEGDYYNTGRETFLLPVAWREGWPIILERGARVPLTAPRPALSDSQTQAPPTTGAFLARDEFDGEALGREWLSLRASPAKWLRLAGGSAELTAQTDSIADAGYPAFLARRQQHMFATAQTEVSLTPREAHEAGLAAFQNDEYFFALGVAVDKEGEPVIRLRRRAGPLSTVSEETLAEAPLAGGGPWRLRIRARGGLYDFEYAEEGGDWRVLVSGADGRILSTKTAGGFVGTVFGIYAD